MTLKSLFAGITGITSLFSVAHADEDWHCDQSPLIIENVRLIGDQSTTSVVIADGIIQWVGSADALPDDHAQSRRYDGDGAFIIPGLIDSHVHLDALPAAKHLQRELDIQTEIYPITMRQTLASGVTTARAHLAGLADMALTKKLSADNCAAFPRVVLSGPGLRGGAPNLNARLMRGVKTPEDASAKVHELAELGASWLALHNITQFSDEELSAIIDASSQVKLKLMADTDSFEDLEFALTLPIISGEYINRSPADVYPDAIMAAISAKDTNFYVVPPIGFYTRSYRFAKDNMPALADDLFSFVPNEIATIMKEQFRGTFERDEYIAGAIAAFPTYQAKFDQLRDAGAKLIIGTDNGSLGQFHHDAVWQEMATWYAMGVSPVEVLAGATTAPAKMLDNSDIGTLTSGAVADIVLYRGNLAAGEFDRRFVDTVIKGGVIFASNGAWVGPNKAQMTARIEAIRADNRE